MYSKAQATAAALYKKCKLMDVRQKEQKINNLKKMRSDQLIIMENKLFWELEYLGPVHL